MTKEESKMVIQTGDYNGTLSTSFDIPRCYIILNS